MKFKSLEHELNTYQCCSLYLKSQIKCNDYKSAKLMMLFNSLRYFRTKINETYNKIKERNNGIQNRTI